MIAQDHTQEGCSQPSQLLSSLELRSADMEQLHPLLRQLTIVDCRSNQWAAIGQRISLLRTLQHLRIENCQGAQAVCRGIGKLTNLRELRMIRCGLTVRGAACFIQLEMLQALDLSGNPNLTDACLSLLLRQLPLLRMLEMPIATNSQIQLGRTRLTLSTIEMLGHNLANMVSFNLSSVELPREYLSRIIGIGPQLSILRLDSCKIEDEGCELIVRKLYALRVLSLQNAKLSAQGIVLAVRRSTGLTSLNVGAVDNIRNYSKHSVSLLMRAGFVKAGPQPNSLLIHRVASHQV